jgi:hypothetical protein
VREEKDAVTETPEREPAAAEQARERIVRLIDFLKSYDAQKNPPVTDIDSYRLFAVRDEQVPDVPAVTRTPGAAGWLTVGFVDLPAAPAIPDELTEYLPSARKLSPIVRPEPAVPLSERRRAARSAELNRSTLLPRNRRRPEWGSPGSCSGRNTGWNEGVDDQVQEPHDQ